MARATRRMLLLATVLCAVAVAPAGAVIGGEPATEDYPWMASLQLKGKHRCGATLVRPQWVLTAAHCLRKRKVLDDTEGVPVRHADLRVVLGRDRLSRKDGQIFRVRRVVAHEDYASDPADGHDVALLELDGSSDAQPIRLVGLDERDLWAPGRRVRVTGWGTSVFLVGRPSNDLMQVDLEMIADEECATSYTAQGFDPATQVCAGQPVIGVKDSCQGDSGGPLFARGAQDRWTQVGVVSQGTGCGFPLFYGVYARIGGQTLHDWIAARLGPLGGDPPRTPPPPATPSAVQLGFGKTVARQAGALVLRVRSSAPVAAVRATLKRRGTVVARGRLAQLDGARRLRMPTSRRPGGTVKVRLAAVDGAGRTVKRTGTARVRR